MDHDPSPKLYRAYLLKEGLRYVFKVKGEEGKQALDRWLAWASRSRLDTFIVLSRKIRRHLTAIHATLDEGMSNALVESVNTKIRLITRVAFGFHGPSPSSPWPCSTSAVTDPTSPAGSDPRISQESRKTTDDA